MRITDGGIVYKQILVNTKLRIGKRSQKTDLTGRSPFRMRRSAYESSAIEEGEEEEEEEEEEGKKKKISWLFTC
jgi:hypothetical protein